MREHEPKAGFAVAQRLLGLLSFTDVAQKRAKDGGAAKPHRGDRELHRKLCSVPVQRSQLDPPIEHRALASRPESLQAAFVCLTVGGGNDRFGERSTEDFLLSPAKQGLRLWVPTRDLAPGVDRDDGIQGGGDEEAEALLTLAQRARGSPNRPDSFAHWTGILCERGPPGPRSTRTPRTAKPELGLS